MSSEQTGAAPGSGAVSERIRALLSRAAEEQLLEQRQVSAVLGELRALVADVDERLATGEQLDGLVAQVAELSARVELRLDAAEARSAELAERIDAATATVGDLAQELVESVSAGVVSRVQARLDSAAADVVASLGGLLESSERRLATHVDDAVLALAEVVLRRRSAGPGPAAPAPTALEPPAAGQTGQHPGAGATATDEQEAADAAAPPERPTDGPAPAEPSASGPSADEPVSEDVSADEPVSEDVSADEPATGESSDAELSDDEPAAEALPDAPPLGDPLRDEPGQDPAGPEHRDGFVLVPADLPPVGAARADAPDDAVAPRLDPTPPVEHERRTTDRRTSERGDGSGRRRRPWWRPA